MSSITSISPLSLSDVVVLPPSLSKKFSVYVLLTPELVVVVAVRGWCVPVMLGDDRVKSNAFDGDPVGGDEVKFGDSGDERGDKVDAVLLRGVLATLWCGLRGV